MSGRPHGGADLHSNARGLRALRIEGYKCFPGACRLEIRPLTILAGANSSGKSSAVQPLLLLKQTLEASYDPGPLLLDGPNVRLTAADQALSIHPGRRPGGKFSVGMEVDWLERLSLTFSSRPRKGIAIARMDYKGPGRDMLLWSTMPRGKIRALVSPSIRDLPELCGRADRGTFQWGLKRVRCFLTPTLYEGKGRARREAVPFPTFFQEQPVFEHHLRHIIHVPGLRGNPERTYGTTAVGTQFPGTFENYVASVVAHWQAAGDSRLRSLAHCLEGLGLTWRVAAQPIDETRVELRVGRLPHAVSGRARDLVNLADVGFGVSQVLPVVVALLAAAPGQLLYIEQPELHLHPRAQTRLAGLLADAALRGVRVVAETHSPLLLLGVQALVAEGKIEPDLVKLHWFERGKSGATKVTSADLDESGAFGDWPEDFADVDLEAQRRYLDAAEKRRAGK